MTSRAKSQSYQEAAVEPQQCAAVCTQFGWRRKGLTVVMIVYSMLFGPVLAEQRWRPVLIDRFGSAWMVDLSSTHETREGTEVWIKKIFDPRKSSLIFQKYKVKPSAYDVELWLFRPDRRVSIIEVIRYDAKGRTVETYDYQDKGKPPVQAIPPGSSIDAIWKLVVPQGEQ